MQTRGCVFDTSGLDSTYTVYSELAALVFHYSEKNNKHLTVMYNYVVVFYHGTQ